MATEQHDKDYGDRKLHRVMILIAALMGVGVFVIPNVEYGPKITTSGYVLITIWTLILVGGGFWAGQVQARYRCPKCGAYLPMLQPEASTKYQHRFYCRTCDVVWTTDIYSGD
jgi:hypothetical protein